MGSRVASTAALLLIWLLAAGCLTTSSAPSRKPPDLKLARELLREASGLVRDDVENYGIAQAIASAQAEISDPVGAEETFRSIRHEAPRFIDVSSRLMAEGYARAGDYERAYAAAERIKDSEPGWFAQNQFAWLRIGSLQAKRGELALAARSFQKAVEATAPAAPEYRAEYLSEIGLAQAKAGMLPEAKVTFSKAVGAAREESKPSDSQRALQKIIDAQARAGLVQDAFNTSALLQDDSRRFFVWTGICRAQADGGDLAGATETAGRIGHPQPAFNAWIDLARACVRQKQLLPAADMHRRAGTAILGIVDPGNRIKSLLDLGRSLAKAGDLEGSRACFRSAFGISDGTRIEAGPEKGPFAELRKLESTPGSIMQGYYFRITAEAEAEAGFHEDAKKTFEKAIAVLGKETKGPLSGVGFIVIAEAQAKVGHFEEALATVRHCGDEDRERVSQLISRTQALRGDFTTALATAMTIPDPGRRSLALLDIVDACLQGGHPDAALEATLHMQDDVLKHGRLRQVAEKQAAADRSDDALKWTRALKSGTARAYALFGTANGLLESARIQ